MLVINSEGIKELEYIIEGEGEDDIDYYFEAYGHKYYLSDFMRVSEDSIEKREYGIDAVLSLLWFSGIGIRLVDEDSVEVFSIEEKG